MKTIKIILTSDIESLGVQGDVVEVTRGYAQNFLIPRKMAIEATRGNLIVLEQKKHALVEKEAQAKAKAEEILQQLEKKAVVIFAKSGKDDLIHGSITSTDIAKAIAETMGIEIDKHKIQLEDSIKTLGDHQVSIKLHPGVEAKVRLQVTESESR
jgi:large subunit ribosomal protein L9